MAEREANIFIENKEGARFAGLSNYQQMLLFNGKFDHSGLTWLYSS
jgi:hypothetical protein